MNITVNVQLRKLTEYRHMVDPPYMIIKNLNVMVMPPPACGRRHYVFGLSARLTYYVVGLSVHFAVRQGCNLK